jgi:hypothetical protein
MLKNPHRPNTDRIVLGSEVPAAVTEPLLQRVINIELRGRLVPITAKIYYSGFL